VTTPQNKFKPYDLEERSYAFALEVRMFLRNTKWDPVSWPDIKQLLRSSGSVAANYVELVESISDADSLYRLRVTKKKPASPAYGSAFSMTAIRSTTIPTKPFTF
jgi:hypothetical protein